MSRHGAVIASLLWHYVSMAVTIVCSLAIVPIAIGHLGDEGYGKWLGLTALTALGAITDLGVAGVLVVRLSKALEKATHTEARMQLASGLVVSAGAAIVAAIVVWCSIMTADRISPGSFATSQHNMAIASILAVSVAMSQFAASLMALPAAQLRPFVAASIMIASTLAWLCVSAVLLPRHGMMGLALGQLVRSAVTAIPLLVYNIAYLAREGIRGAVALDRDSFLSFAGMGIIALALRWIQGIQGSFDVLCITTTQGPKAAAMYANTAKPTGLATGLATAFGGALLPSFTRYLARENGPPAFHLFLNSLRLTVIMAGALAIGFVSVRRQFLAAWVGPQFILQPALVIAIAFAAIASTGLSFASYMFGGTGKLAISQGVLFVEGIVRFACMACGAYALGSFGLAVAATPTPMIATVVLIVSLAHLTGVRVRPAQWMALVTDCVLIGVGLLSVNALPEFPLQRWQIPLFAATCAGLALLALTMRSPPLREMLLNTARAVLPTRLQWSSARTSTKTEA